MILDNNLIFDTATAVTSTTVVSANVIDFAAARDMGPGEDIIGIVLCNQPFLAGTAGSSTVNIQVQVCTTSAGTYSTILESGNLGTAALGATTATTRAWAFKLAQNNQGLNGQRYMRLNYSATINTTNFSTGSFQAFLIQGGDLDVYYTSGIGTISN